MEIKDWQSLASFSSEKMQKINLFETERFFCDLYCLLPGQSQKVHSHAENDKIYSVLQGNLVVTLGGSETEPAEDAELSEGQSVLAKARVPHGIRNDSQQQAVCMVFMTPHPSWQSKQST